jgi:flavin-dependent dehydrogenase
MAYPARVSDAARHDVAIIGAGIAGLAASVLLRRAGMSVVCLDATSYPHRKVGESLDWSSPGLFRRLGIDAEALLAGEIATLKKSIVVYEIGQAPWTAAPPHALRRRPLGFETVTLHVDRTALDARLFEHARALGTDFIWERVASVDVNAERVVGCSTAAGRRVDARWFIDASGTARVLARAMDIPVVAYGRQKVCLWTYFHTPPLHEGTAFFVENGAAYLSWVWDIPISPQQTSVGYVLAAEALRDRRGSGASLQRVLVEELSRYPRFRGLLDAQPAFEVERTSFQPYVTTRVCGANWLMIGEAASMPDPLTGNGVTSGMRHARHAVEAILAAGAGGQISPPRRRTYGQHVFRLGHAFNAHIEHTIYRPPLRRGLGLKTATYVYTFFAFFMNALHARFEPRGRVGMVIFSLLFTAARAWIGGWNLVARAVLTLRPGLDGAR